jgi:nitrate reductase beta subunit
MRGGGRGGVRESEVRWDVRDQKSVRGGWVDKKDGRLKDASGISMECR